MVWEVSSSIGLDSDEAFESGKVCLDSTFLLVHDLPFGATMHSMKHFKDESSTLKKYLHPSF